MSKQGHAHFGRKQVAGGEGGIQIWLVEPCKYSHTQTKFAKCAPDSAPKKIGRIRIVSDEAPQSEAVPSTMRKIAICRLISGS